jgi:hypothetical protein
MFVLSQDSRKLYSCISWLSVTIFAIWARAELMLNRCCDFPNSIRLTVSIYANSDRLEAIPYGVVHLLCNAWGRGRDRLWCYTVWQGKGGVMAFVTQRFKIFHGLTIRHVHDVGLSLQYLIQRHNAERPVPFFQTAFCHLQFHWCRLQKGCEHPIMVLLTKQVFP